MDSQRGHDEGPSDGEPDATLAAAPEGRGEGSAFWRSTTNRTCKHPIGLLGVRLVVLGRDAHTSVPPRAGAQALAWARTRGWAASVGVSVTAGVKRDVGAGVKRDGGRGRRNVRGRADGAGARRGEPAPSGGDRRT